MTTTSPADAGRRNGPGAASLPPGLALPRAVRAGLVALPLAFLAVFYVWPLVTLVSTVVDGSTLGKTLTRDGLWRIVWFTCWQAMLSTVATVVVGLGPAYLTARWDFPGRRLLTASVTVPFLLPTVVVGAAFVALLPSSLETSVFAIVLAHVFFNVAVVVRVVGGMWSQLPADLIAAARLLGASPWRATREVTLPLLRPAVVAAASITFLFSFTSYGVVRILGGAARATIEVEIARRAVGLGDVGGAAVLSLLQLALLVALVAVTVRTQRRASTAVRLRTVRSQRPRSIRARLAVAGGASVTAIVFVAPLAALAVSSVRPGGGWSLAAWRGFGDAPVRPGAGGAVDLFAATTASLRAAAAATVVALVIGGLAALAIASTRRSGRLLDVGSMLPLGTSAVTIGFGMLITFDRAPFDWRDEPWLVPVGHALVAVPFVVRSVLPVLRSRPAAWREAAALLGASPVRSWWEIDVRLLRRPLVVGACFAAAVSLGEFGATTFLSRTGQETLPIVIARLLGRAGDIPRAQASALALVLALVTTLVLVAVELLDRPGGDRARGA